jgi:hypothetical protein
MKIARFVLKWVAIGLCVAATVCAVIAYWDKIQKVFRTVTGKFAKKGVVCCTSEYEDYADCDDWANADPNATL